MLLFTVAGAANITAVSVAKDMTEGIIARFKTMRISAPAVLAGHVFSSLALTLISLAVTIAVALLIGSLRRRPPALARCPRGPRAASRRADLAISRSWPAREERRDRSNIPMLLLLLPFLGSGFMPVASMPAGLRWFADNQPFTPITNTVRSLLTNQHIGSASVKAIVWCLAITAAAIYGPGIFTTADPPTKKTIPLTPHRTAGHFSPHPGNTVPTPTTVIAEPESDPRTSRVKTDGYLPG